MKIIPILFILFHSAYSLSAQTTYIPDDNFEQALIYYGFDDVMDDYVLTANISTVEYLQLYDLNITNLTGIEDFMSLVGLNVNANNLTSLNISNNPNLESLACDLNQLTELDISQNENLNHVTCTDNLLTSLDLSNNALLEILYCGNNYISNLDLRNTINLRSFSYNSYSSYPYMQAIESIDIRNGNNSNIEYCSINNNVNLRCIYVDDKNAPHNNWHKNYGQYVNNETECDAILSINNLMENSVVLYPNPVSEILFIKNNDSLNIQRIEIYNILGGRILDLSNGFDQVNFEDVSSGLYFISIKTEYGTVTKKIMKK